MRAPQHPVVIHRGPNRNFPLAGFAAGQGLTVVAYVDETSSQQMSGFDSVPIITFEAWRARYRDIPSLVCALEPVVRRAIVERITAAGGTFQTMRRSNSDAVSHTVTFGEGTLAGDGPLFIGCATTVGRHTVIMTPVSVGHDVTLGDFVTIHPSAAISGYVVIEDDVVIGVGAVIVNGSSTKALKIGRAARIDIGAVVTKSVRPGMIVTGNPARPAGFVQTTT